MAEERGCGLTDLTPDDLRTLHPAFDDDVAEIWSYERSAESRDADGGSSRRAVEAQLVELMQWLGEKSDG